MTSGNALRSVVEVHIAPLGYEYDRVKEPVLQYKADELYLLADPIREEVAYHTELVEELETAGVDVHTYDVDLEDMYDVLGEVTTIANNYAEDIVRVNVSSGPKLATVGAALACMATHAIGYHVHPESRPHPVDERPRTEGMKLAEQLPNYPLETPTQNQIRILDYIESTTDATSAPNKSDLIAFGEENNLDFLTRSDPSNDKAKFALLNSRILDPLLSKGFIEVESVGRTKQVTLTATGKNALRAFRHKLP